MNLNTYKQVLAATMTITALALPGAVQEAKAAAITFRFTGIVTTVCFPPPECLPVPGLPFSVQDSVSGFYTFESTTPDSNPAHPNAGLYLGAITNLQFTIGTYSASATGGNISVIFNLGPFNPPFTPTDEYRHFSNTSTGISGPSVAGLELDNFQVRLLGVNTGGLTSDALPLTPPSLAAFPTRDFEADFFTPGVGAGFVSGQLVSLSLILPVSVDIKPQGCPNPINVKSRGVLPVAILGTADFDVTTIDPVSIRLEGIAPTRSALEDVATPFEPLDGFVNASDCTDQGSDGFTDLTLKFDTQEIVSALGGVQDGDVLILTLVGELSDGTPIQGEDVVVIKKKGKK